MPKAKEPDTILASAASPRPLLEIEPHLHDLEGSLGVLRHLIAVEDLTVKPGEWLSVIGTAEAATESIRAYWEEALDRNRDREEAHNAELVATEAKRAAPGSPMDLEQAAKHWRVLTTVATMVLKDAIARESTDGQR